MFFIHRKAKHSGVAIAQELQCKYVEMWGHRKEICGPTITKKYVNWGCDYTILPEWVTPNNCWNYNIRTGSSKILFYQAAKNMGLRVPVFYHTAPEKWEGILLGRTDKRSGGRGITLYHQSNTVRKHDFYTIFEKSIEEYRIILFRKRRIATLKKVAAHEKADQFIRSYNNGWLFQYTSCTKEMHSIAITSLQAASLDFGAVDILLLENESLLVLEVNSAPGLSGNGLRRLISFFRKYLIKQENS